MNEDLHVETINILERPHVLCAVGGHIDAGLDGRRRTTNQIAKPSNDLEALTLEQLRERPGHFCFKKKKLTFFTSPAAISVITQDDIRRMGVTVFLKRCVWSLGMDVGADLGRPMGGQCARL